MSEIKEENSISINDREKLEKEIEKWKTKYINLRKVMENILEETIN